MSDAKYHTIDPLILETLNLNEKRMNYILDILHGRDPKEHPKTERRMPVKSLTKNRTIASITQDDSVLPPIPITVRRTKPKEEPRSAKHENNASLVGDFSARKSKTIEKTEHSEQRHKRYESNLKSPPGKHERTQEQPINIEQEVLRTQAQKKEQLMKDYMMGKLKKSRSMEINPKDIYRLEIQHLVAELTPIQQLEQAEKKMQRLKKRHKHLVSFDRSYYSKLSQGELLNLS